MWWNTHTCAIVGVFRLCYLLRIFSNYWYNRQFAKNEDDVLSRAQSVRRALIEKLRNIVRYAIFSCFFFKLRILLPKKLWRAISCSVCEESNYREVTKYGKICCFFQVFLFKLRILLPKTLLRAISCSVSEESINREVTKCSKICYFFMFFFSN